MENKQNVEPTSIRLNKNLLDKIKKDASKEGRSVTKQIEYMIKKYYELKEI